MKKFKGIEVDESEVTIDESEGDIYIYDKNNDRIYHEYDDGYWVKKEYDENHNVVYYENSLGLYASTIYDKNNNEIYLEDSDGDWKKWEYDENNNIVYYEDSNGVIIDSRNKK